ncbi:predicted protein [Streptomyces iranensis]|uniref:Uncharacterized protein n=1 Tax=Streptomyces iranensis TaxID=576784 RepID=A0A060ZW77_9ACTN|nr:predicted protein [Streptomyces iranensis]
MPKAGSSTGWRVPQRQGRFLPASVVRRLWTGPNDGAVRVTKRRGCVRTVSGTLLPPESPARIRW